MTWSDGLYRLLGYEAGSVEPSAEPFVARIHPDDRGLAEAVGFVAVVDGAAIDAQFRIVLPDGRVRWIANKGEVFTDTDGAPSWAAGALLDITEIHERQADLAGRERRYRSITAASALGVWHADAKGEIVEAEFLAAFTGRPMDELVGSGWLESVHPDDVEPVRALRNETVALGCSIEFSFRVRHHSGEHRWILWRAVPTRGPGGEVQEWVGSIEDIQDRREAEFRLRLNEERLRLALDAGGMVAWDYDAATGNVTWSEDAQAVLGLHSGPLADFMSLVHVDDRPRARGVIEGTAAQGERCEAVYRIVDEDGATRWLHGRGKLVRGGYFGADRGIGVTVDATAKTGLEAKLKHAVEELALALRRQRTLEEVAGGIVWTARSDGRAEDLPGWREFTGQTVEQIAAWGWLSAVHPADRERLREALVRQIDTPGGLVIDYRIRSRTGEYRWFRSRGAPVLQDDGTVVEWVGVLQPCAGPGSAPSSRESGPDLRASHVAEPQYASGAQVRAARGILRWSVRDLAEASAVSASTIRRIEEEDGLPQSRDLTKLQTIRATLEKAGVRFGPVLGGQGGVAPG
jgi:PAS domain S-box-containing protein